MNVEHRTPNVEVGMMEGHAPSWPRMLDTERSQAGTPAPLTTERVLPEMLMR